MTETKTSNHHSPESHIPLWKSRHWEILVNLFYLFNRGHSLTVPEVARQLNFICGPWVIRTVCRPFQAQLNGDTALWDIFRGVCCTTTAFFLWEQRTMEENILCLGWLKSNHAHILGLISLIKPAWSKILVCFSGSFWSLLIYAIGQYGCVPCKSIQTVQKYSESFVYANGYFL